MGDNEGVSLGFIAAPVPREAGGMGGRGGAPTLTSQDIEEIVANLRSQKDRFILAGRPEFMGSGGNGGVTDDKSQQEAEAFSRLAEFMQKRQNEEEFTEKLNGFLQAAGIEELSLEEAAELLFYAREHQADRWAELFDFFVSEAAALFLEAMEAVNGDE